MRNKEGGWVLGAGEDSPTPNTCFQFIIHTAAFIIRLKRYLVVLDLRLLRRRAAVRRARRGRGGLRLLADGDALNVRGAVEELHVRGVDLKRVARLAVAVSPLLDVESSLDVDAPPLRQILRDVLGLPAPRVDAEPGGDVLLLASLVPAPLVRGDGEMTDLRPLRRVTVFSGPPLIYNNDAFV